MVMMMVGNAAVAAADTAANTQNSGAHEDDRLLCWPVYCCCCHKGREILQSSAPGQQAAPLISQRLTLFLVLCGSLLFVRL